MINIDKIGGRKVAACITALAIGVTMALVKEDVPPNLLTLLISTVGLYIGGNVGNKLALGRGLKSKVAVAVLEPKTPEVVSAAPQPDSQVDTLTNKVDMLSQAVAETQGNLQTVINHLTVQAQQDKAVEAARQAAAAANPGSAFPRPF